MFFKSLLKKPILAIGILLCIISLWDMHRRGFFFSRWEKLQATSCKSVLVMLNKRIPANWTTSCEKNTLSVIVKFQAPNELPIKNLRQVLYRELANNLTFIAKNSLAESLERVSYVQLKIIHPKLTINALGQGKFVIKLKTLTNTQFIKGHLKATVQVQEVPN